MNIRIGKKHIITSTSMNIVLKEKRTKGVDSKQPGEEYWVDIGYYGKVEHAVNALLDRKVRVSDARTLADVVKVVENTRKLIKDSLEGI